MVTSYRERRRNGIASGIHVAPRLLRQAARLLDHQAHELQRQADATREEARQLRSLAEDYEDLRGLTEWAGPDIEIRTEGDSPA